MQVGIIGWEQRGWERTDRSLAAPERVQVAAGTISESGLYAVTILLRHR